MSSKKETRKHSRPRMLRYNLQLIYTAAKSRTRNSPTEITASSNGRCVMVSTRGEISHVNATFCTQRAEVATVKLDGRISAFFHPEWHYQQLPIAARSQQHPMRWRSFRRVMSRDSSRLSRSKYGCQNSFLFTSGCFWLNFNLLYTPCFWHPHKLSNPSNLKLKF